MVLTLDEAIKNAEEVASEWRDIDMAELDAMYCGDTECIGIHKSRCIERAEELEQLAELLKGYKRLLEQTRWIPCSERLPEYGTEVLTCSRGGYVEIQSIEHYGEYWENQHGDWTDFDEVIAWMPLPEPYKPESGGKE